MLQGLRSDGKIWDRFLSSMLLREDHRKPQKCSVIFRGNRLTTNKVINIENKYHEMVTHFLGIDIEVKMTAREVNVKKKAIHFSIPIPRGLLKAIERFLKMANKTGIILNTTMRLFPLNFFLQIPMKVQI